MEAEKWLSAIDKNTEDFLSLSDSLDQEQLNWKPAPQRWSIAQNLDHLIGFNESYFSSWATLREGTWKAPFTARLNFLVVYLGKSLLKYSQPDRGKKSKTFPIWEPDESNLPIDILAKFANHQAELKKEIEKTSPLVRKGAVLSSPANRYIVYKLDTAFDILVAHERRHLEQCKEILEEMGKASLPES